MVTREVGFQASCPETALSVLKSIALAGAEKRKVDKKDFTLENGQILDGMV